MVSNCGALNTRMRPRLPLAAKRPFGVPWHRRPGRTQLRSIPFWASSSASRCPSEPRLVLVFCASRDQAHRGETLESESLEARQASTNEGKKFAGVTGEEEAMYVITGATGNTGGVVAERLLAEGEKVRVVGRDSERLERFMQNGAESFIADATDAGALTKAFAGAKAVYAMIPPKYCFPGRSRVRRECERCLARRNRGGRDKVCRRSEQRRSGQIAWNGSRRRAAQS